MMHIEVITMLGGASKGGLSALDNDTIFKTSLIRSKICLRNMNLMVPILMWESTCPGTV